MMTAQIFFSNQLEILYQHLKRSLFFSPLIDPLSRRIVIVYGPAIKSWLMTRMATDPDLGIAFGIEFVYISQAFHSLLQLCQSKKEHIPSRMEICFAIEQELLQIIRNTDSAMEEATDWSPLFDYLHTTLNSARIDRSFSKKTEKRLIALSEHLADLFQEYGRFFPEMLREWEIAKTEKDWQMSLWNKIYTKYPWTYVGKALQNPILPPQATSIHFFSISFLTPSEIDFLARLSTKTALYYYLLSPCAFFWSDIRSDKEAFYIQSNWKKKGERNSSALRQFDELFKDRNPLLANFGRLGRHMSSSIEELDAVTHADYLLPNSIVETHTEDALPEDIHLLSTEKPLSLLQAIQCDLLLMRNPLQQKKTINIVSDPNSIQLHIASSLKREIEILYHNLIHLMTQDSSLHLDDILVMAPQISDYVPYIQSVFSNKEVPLDFHVLDLPAQMHSEIVQGFLQLFSIAESRWESYRILELFALPSFQRRHKITLDDYQVIQQWVEKGGILWGSDIAHRNEILQSKLCQNEMIDKSQIGTWEQGFYRLLLGLTTIAHNDSSQEISAGIEVDLSQSELLSTCIHLLRSLRDDLSPLHDQTQMTIENWANYFQCLLENYFAPDTEDSVSTNDFILLQEQFQRLRDSSYFFAESLFPFTSIQSHLFSLLTDCKISYREDFLSSIRCCSLLPLRSIPAKVICILGLQEEQFPRQHIPSSLRSFEKKKTSSYCPSSIDFDRYLFLEILHSAQEFLLFSFQGYSPTDGKEIYPSSLVQELFSYCDRYYQLKGEKVSTQCIFRHPFHSFDSIYFCNKKGYYNYSQFDFQISTLLQKPKAGFHSFLTTFVKREQKKEVGHFPILSKHLTALTKNPIKFHLNMTLGMYLQKEQEIQEEEKFLLSPLEKYQLKQLLFKKPFEKVIEHGEREGIFPLGLCKEIAVDTLRSEIETIYDCFSKHSLHPSDLFVMEFSSSCVSPTLLENHHWLFPPIRISLHDTLSVSITGKIPHASRQGLVAMTKGSLTDLWKIWPEFLLYCCGANQYPDQFQKKLLLPMINKEKESFFEDPIPHLSRFIRYYFQCLQDCSPLMPDWISPLLEKDVTGLEQKMFGLFTHSFGYADPYVRWVFHKKKLPESKLMIQNWHSTAEEQLQDIHHHWKEK